MQVKFIIIEVSFLITSTPAGVCLLICIDFEAAAMLA